MRHFNFFKIIDINDLKKVSYEIRYTFQSNLLSELILYLRKCPNQKMYESESASLVLWALPEIQNQFQKQIWLKSIPNYKTKKKNSKRCDQKLKK